MIFCSVVGSSCHRFCSACIQRIIASHWRELARCCVMSRAEWHAIQLLRTSSQSPVLTRPVAGSISRSAAWVVCIDPIAPSKATQVKARTHLRIKTPAQQFDGKRYSDILSGSNQARPLVARNPDDPWHAPIPRSSRFSGTTLLSANAAKQND